MKKCNVSTFVLLTMAIVITLPFDLVEAQTVDAKIDIIVIMEQGNRSIEVAAYKKFGTYFEFGQDKTRFAVVFHVSVKGFDPESFNKHHPNILNMTADQKLYERKLDNFRDPWRVDRYPDPPFFYGDGEFFVHARNQFAGYSGSGRAKALFHIVQYYLPNRGRKLYDQRAKELAGTGVWLYTFVQNYTGGNYTANKDDFNRTAQYTEPKRHFSWPGNYTIRLSDQMVKVKDAVLHDICEWDAACRYKESNRAQCTWDSWLVHSYTNNPQQCDPFKPKATGCSHDDCLTECNRRWPWEKAPSCDGKCGVRLDGTRQGNPPKYMEHCPMSIECSPCPTTAAPTTTSTTTTTPTTTTTTTSTTTPTTTPTSTTTPTTITTTTSTTTTTPTTTTTTTSTTTRTSTTTSAMTPSTTMMTTTTPTTTTTSAMTPTTIMMTTTTPTTTLTTTTATTPSTSTHLDATSSKSTHGDTTQSSSTSEVVDTSPDVVTESEVTSDGGNGETEAPSGGPQIGLIIGAAVGGLVFLILLVLIVVCATKKKKPVPSKAVVKGAAPASSGPLKTVPMKKSADTRKEPSGKEAMVGLRMRGGQAAVAADISMAHKSSLATGVGKSAKSDAKGLQPKVEASKKKEPMSKMETGKSKGPTPKMETSKVKAPASKRVPTAKKK